MTWSRFAAWAFYFLVYVHCFVLGDIGNDAGDTLSKVNLEKTRIDDAYPVGPLVPLETEKSYLQGQISAGLDALNQHKKIAAEDHSYNDQDKNSASLSDGAKADATKVDPAEPAVPLQSGFVNHVNKDVMDNTQAQDRPSEHQTVDMPQVPVVDSGSLPQVPQNSIQQPELQPPISFDTPTNPEDKVLGSLPRVPADVDSNQQSLNNPMVPQLDNSNNMPLDLPSIPQIPKTENKQSVSLDAPSNVQSETPNNQQYDLLHLPTDTQQSPIHLPEVPQLDNSNNMPLDLPSIPQIPKTENKQSVSLDAPSNVESETPNNQQYDLPHVPTVTKQSPIDLPEVPKVDMPVLLPDDQMGKNQQMDTEQSGEFGSNQSGNTQSDQASDPAIIGNNEPFNLVASPPYDVVADGKKQVQQPDNSLDNLVIQKPDDSQEKHPSYGEVEQTADAQQPGELATQQSGELATQQPRELASLQPGELATQQPRESPTQQPGDVAAQTPGDVPVSQSTDSAATNQPVFVDAVDQPGPVSTKQTNNAAVQQSGNVTAVPQTNQKDVKEVPEAKGEGPVDKTAVLQGKPSVEELFPTENPSSIPTKGKIMYQQSSPDYAGLPAWWFQTTSEEPSLSTGDVYKTDGDKDDDYFADNDYTDDDDDEYAGIYDFIYGNKDDDFADDDEDGYTFDDDDDDDYVDADDEGYSDENEDYTDEDIEDNYGNENETDLWKIFEEDDDDTLNSEEDYEEDYESYDDEEEDTETDAGKHMMLSPSHFDSGIGIMGGGKVSGPGGLKEGVITAEDIPVSTDKEAAESMISFYSWILLITMVAVLGFFIFRNRQHVRNYIVAVRNPGKRQTPSHKNAEESKRLITHEMV